MSQLSDMLQEHADEAERSLISQRRPDCSDEKKLMRARARRSWSVPCAFRQ